ncbi:MAG TPA: hypothetical protein VMS12_06715, partial [Thermoanaerobaculia bacterium]|nr:hypothetical protein [Thermoanaerobaculia bacterium]
MIAVAAVIVAALAAGWPAARLAGVRGVVAVRLGTAFLLGAGIVAASLFLLSLLGLAWSRTSILILFSLIASLLWWYALKKVEPAQELLAPSDRRFVPLVMVADLSTLLLVVGHALYATASAPFETDFLSIWGLKARVFAENQGIDWVFLASPWNFFSHPDYPLLLPLLFDAAAVTGGGWDDRWLGLFTTAFGAAALLSIRGLLRYEMAAGFAAMITFVLASMVLSPWIGMAEAPMIAYAAVSLLFFRRALRLSAGAHTHVPEWTAAAWLLACAVMTKNEGYALVIAVAAGVVIALRGRRLANLVRLWPAVAVAGGWMVVRALLGLENDLTVGSPWARARSADPVEMMRLLWVHGGGAIPWVGLALAAVVGAFESVRRERFLLAVVAVQLAFYLAAYVITPNGMEWQIRWSWGRLVTHLLPL